MTRQEEKFYKVHIYHIAWIAMSLLGVLSMFSGHHDESRHLFMMGIIFYITADIRGDILEMQRKKQND